MSNSISHFAVFNSVVIRNIFISFLSAMPLIVNNVEENLVRNWIVWLFIFAMLRGNKKVCNSRQKSPTENTRMTEKHQFNWSLGIFHCIHLNTCEKSGWSPSGVWCLKSSCYVRQSTMHNNIFIKRSIEAIRLASHFHLEHFNNNYYYFVHYAHDAFDSISMIWRESGNIWAFVGKLELCF